MVIRLSLKLILSISLIGLMYFISIIIDASFFILIEGGLIWLFAFNIFPVASLVVLVAFAVECIAIFSAKYVRLIVISGVVIVMFYIFLNEFSTETAFIYGAAAVILFLTSSLLARFARSGNCVCNSFLLHDICIFFFTLGAFAIIGGRAIYDLQIYILGITSDSNYLLTMGFVSLILSLQSCFFSRPTAWHLMSISFLGLISLVLVNPALKAVALAIAFIFSGLAAYGLKKIFNPLQTSIQRHAN